MLELRMQNRTLTPDSLVAGVARRLVFQGIPARDVTSRTVVEQFVGNELGAH